MNNSSGNNPDAVALVCIWKTGMMQASTHIFLYPFLSAVLVLFHLHDPLVVISLRDVAPPTTCPICVAALKAWQTPPQSDSLQQTYLTSSVSRTQLMEMADQRRIESSKRSAMSNEDLICEFPACACFTSHQKSFTVATSIIVFLETFSDLYLCCPRVWSKQSLCFFPQRCKCSVRHCRRLGVCYASW